MTISAGFCFLWALCLLILPLGWTMGALLAALTHEFAHCLAVWLCGGQIHAVRLGGQGAVIEASPMTPGKEAFCALAGPLGSFLVMLTSEHFPEAAVCAFVQGIYNLIPFYPLDGGRMIRSLFSYNICCAVEAFFLILIGGSAFWLSVHYLKLGLTVALIGSFPLIRGKIACKESKQAVQ